MAYADLDNVRALLPGRTISTSSAPTQAEVQNWLDEAHAELDNALAAAGLPAPYSASSAVLILRRWVSRYVAGLVRGAHASAGGDGENEDGKRAEDAWAELLKEVARQPELVGARLGGGNAPASASRVAGLAVKNRDGLSLTYGDLDPVFTMREPW